MNMQTGKEKKEILDASFQQLEKEEREGAKTPFWQQLWLHRARWLYLLGSVVALGLLYPLYQLYLIDRSNPLIVVGLIACVIGSGFLFVRGWRATREQETVIVGAVQPIGRVNSLNIYAKKDETTGQIYAEKMAFEWDNNPTGQPWQSLNNGKWYHLNIWDIVAGKLKPFVLPDSQYFDPREFANVITMPAHKKLFEHRASLFQKIAPWVMTVAFLISIFGLIVTTPS